MFIKYNSFLDIIINDIIPLTKISIRKGNKLFGAAIIRKNDFKPIVIGTNDEIHNPLLHGEITTINNFYNLNISKKIKTSDCIFLSTHEPCSLCLSAITWAGFTNFYYFFPYSDTKKSFRIPHDLKILKEVFKIKNGNYNRDNKFWKSYSIVDGINKLNSSKKKKLDIKIKKIYEEYQTLSKYYQNSKKNNQIPLK